MIFIAACGRVVFSADPCVARVNFHVLRLSAIRSSLGPDATAEEQKRFAEQWADQKVLYLNAKKHFRLDSGMREQLRSYKEDLLIARYNDAFVRQKIFISENDVLNYYQKHRGEFTADRRAVFAQVYTCADPETAHDILNALKKESRGAVQPDLRLLREGECVENIDVALFAKNNPSLVGPIHSGGIYYVISVLERYERNSTFRVEHVREDIIQRLHIEEYIKTSQQKLKDLKERFNVKIFEIPA